MKYKGETGTASRAVKTVHRVLRKMQVPEAAIPHEYKDVVLHESARTEGLGSVQVRRISGIKQNRAAKALKQFEKNLAGGRDDLIEKMEAADLSEGQKAILDALKNNPKKKSLAFIVAESGEAPIKIFDAYSKGCAALGRMKALVHAHERLPALVKDVFRHALDVETFCADCVGSGKIKALRTGIEDNLACPACEGTGARTVSSSHKEWATKLALDITKMTGKEAVPLVQFNQQINTAQQGGFMERMTRTSDKILYDDVVEAEVVAEGND